MKLEQQVVSLELAKKLKELGVKQESYFIWEEYFDREQGDNFWQVIPEYRHEPQPDHDIVSAFTVAELGEMLPAFIMNDGLPHFLEISAGEGKQIETDCWMVEYSRKITVHYTEAGTLADAMAKMLIFLLENKLINLEDTKPKN